MKKSKLFIFGLVSLICSLTYGDNYRFDLYAKYATSNQLATTNLEFGQIVINSDDVSDMRVGDGETPGGISVGKVNGVVQYVEDISGNKTAVTIGYLDINEPSPLGEYAFTQGEGNRAEGFCSHAEGVFTYALNDYSHAEGLETYATGQAAHSEGRGGGEYQWYCLSVDETDNRILTISASYPAPKTNDIVRYNGLSYRIIDVDTSNGKVITLDRPLSSFPSEIFRILIYDAVADGEESHTEGKGTITYGGEANHAEGMGTIAYGERASHAEGYHTVAGGNYSHAEGYDTKATNTIAHSEGSHTVASGYCSHSEGRKTIASGSVSHTEGANTEARGYGAHAEGTNTVAEGDFSHAEGIGTFTDGNYSKVEGAYTHVSELYSWAAGIKSYANSIGAFVWQGAEDTNVVTYYSHGHGTYNINPIGGITGFYIGEDSISDLFVSKDTDIYGNNSAMTIGSRDSSQGVGVGSIANGNGVSAIGTYSHAEGAFAKSLHDYSYTFNGNQLEHNYSSHGIGTINVNPVGGTDGIYIGNSNLTTIIIEQANRGANSAYIDPFNVPADPSVDVNSLTYTWSINGTPINNNSSTWITDSEMQTGLYKIDVTASDNNGHIASAGSTLAIAPSLNNRYMEYFYLVTNLTDLTDGDYIITGATNNGAQYAMHNTTSGSGTGIYIERYGGDENYMDVKDFIILDDGQMGEIVFNVNFDEDGYMTIYNPDAGYVAKKSTEKNNAAGFTDDIDDTSRWIPYCEDGFVYATNVAQQNFSLRWYQISSGLTKFSCYKGTQKPLRFYKRAVGYCTQDMDLNMDMNGPSYAIPYGWATEFQAFPYTGISAYTFSSDNGSLQQIDLTSEESGILVKWLKPESALNRYATMYCRLKLRDEQCSYSLNLHGLGELSFTDWNWIQVESYPGSSDFTVVSQWVEPNYENEE